MRNSNQCIDPTLKKINLHKRYRQFMRQMGMRDVYEVPIRKNGMTGSGKRAECHGNVQKLQALYGGKVVVGFSIVEKQRDDSDNINVMSFQNHSVWLTPEGKLVDVTLNWLDDDTMWFSPVVSFDVNKEEWIIFGDYELPRNYKKKGLYVDSPLFKEDNDRKSCHVSFSSSLNKDSVAKREARVDLTREDYLDIYGNAISEFGGFTERSSATGKSWDEIWKRYSFTEYSL